MSARLPIICSNRGSMPEILKDGGIYFDPEDISSIVNSLQEIILNNELRINVSKKSLIILMNFLGKNVQI